MGLQLSGKGEILVDGRPPQGWRERLWAWFMLRQAKRAVKEAAARKDVPREQREAEDREESLRICRRRQFLNALTGACAVVQVPICAYSGWVREGFWRWACFAAVILFAWRAVVDWRTYRKLRGEERDLVVDDVHAL
jgi:hypothetical protein